MYGRTDAVAPNASSSRAGGGSAAAAGGARSVGALPPPRLAEIAGVEPEAVVAAHELTTRPIAELLAEAGGAPAGSSGGGGGEDCRSVHSGGGRGGPGSVGGGPAIGTLSGDDSDYGDYGDSFMSGADMDESVSRCDSCHLPSFPL